MRTTSWLLSCGLTLALAGGTVFAQTTPPAPAATAARQLRTDPAVRTGVLANGMRYQIFKNATPPNNASLRLRVDVGSLYEADDQRGLAHFLEHMVLNGTRNVPEGEMIKRLERAGLKFGPDTNASTDFRQTVYMLDLPQTDAGTVDTALFLLREVAGEATLAASAIDSERGIILSEERTRNNANYRIAIDELGYQLKGDLLPNRIPIGSTEVIRTAPRERFTSFYNAYYRPERATLIAVGDFDVDAMEKKIKAQFGNWKGRGKAGAELAPSALGARKPEARMFVEAGGPTRVSLSWISPPDLRPDSRAVQIEKLRRQLGFQMLSRRFERIAATSANPPFIGAGAVRTGQSERAEVTQLIAVAQAGRWKEALAAIEQEQRKALQYGFTQAELDREVTGYRAVFTAAASGAATRTSAALAQAMVNAVSEDDVFTTPADDLALFEDAVRGLTAQSVTEAARAAFAGDPIVHATSPTAVEGGDAALLAAYQGSREAAVAAGAAQQAAAWPYQSFGAPGAVAERKEIADLGVTTVRFANGVRLTVKPTAFAKDEILIAARIGAGLREVSTARPSPAWAIGGGGFIAGGLGKISYEDLQETLASKVYTAGFAVGEDAFLFQGKTRPQDLATQMEVLAAYAADPAWRPSGWDRLRAFSGTIQDQLAGTPGGVFGRDAAGLLHSGDRRWVIPSREEMAAMQVSDGRAMLDMPLKSGAVEIVMVGDVSVDEAIARVAATFGALGPRGPEAGPAGRVAFPSSALVKRTHKGRADQGLAYIAWPTSDFFADQKRTRTLNLLGEVLQLRLIDEIREKQGTTYSPRTGHDASQTFAGYGYLSAQIEAPPEKLDGFLADAAKIAADLRDRPVTADELQRARKPLVENIMRQKTSNGWWLTNLAGVQTRPEIGVSLRQGIAQYEAVTPADLQKAARDYLINAKAWKMEVTPEAK